MLKGNGLRKKKRGQNVRTKEPVAKEKTHNRFL